MNKGKLDILDTGLAAYCPACKSYHLFDKRWTHNGDFDKPSFTPSMHVNAGQPDACHSFLTDGVWHYCPDSKHEYAGRSLALDWEGEAVHVIPINDLREHDENTDGSCWCNPRIDQEENGRVIVHDPLDGRVFLEKLNVQRGELAFFLAKVSQAYLDPYRFTAPKDCDKNVFIALQWLDKRAGVLKANPLIDDISLVTLTQFLDCWLFIDGEA